MSRAYYNEFDKNAAAWLRELIKAGLIADGDVDERSIEDVLPSELKGYNQCHFFAGIGVWSYALRQAGWSDDRSIWTGSCPCQPFSAAGKGTSFDDERHLWPAFHHLIKECRPESVVGEQVASKDADAWIDLVQDDMEGVDYSFAAIAFPSSGVGAPHIRDRTYWVGMADADNKGSQGWSGVRKCPSELFVGKNGVAGGVADSNGNREKQQYGNLSEASRLQNKKCKSEDSSDVFERGGSNRNGQRDLRGDVLSSNKLDAGPTNGFWRDADWLFCRDGKWRSVEPGTFPLVDGATKGVVPSSNSGLPINANKTGEGRVMRLRGYGNAINAFAAKAFIECVMDIAK